MTRAAVVRKPSPSTPSELPEFRIAAIDVGSNSLHMAVAQADPDGALTTLWRLKEMVGLGRISFPSRRLTREAMDRAVTTLGRFQQAARARGCEKVLAIATSAVREAENGGDFLQRVRQDLGMTIRVVSARDEARLIYLGVRHAIDLDARPHFIVDIGGGSVEFIVGDATRPAYLESRKLGAARMTARYVGSDPISPADLRTLTAHYDRELGPICRDVTALHPVAAIGTSGTMENLAAMCAGLNGKGDKAAHAEAASIERGAMEKLAQKLIASRSAQRAEMPGLDEQRKGQVIAGAVLVNELFRRLDLQSIRLCRSGRREGILLDYLGRHLPDLQIRREVPDPRGRSVLDLARRCQWHQSHAEQVARLCLALFDQTRPLHELATEDRELIEYGSLLHDIGWHIAREDHHKHGQYLVQHGNLQGFAPEEVRVIGNIVRYHRKSDPSRRHDRFASLSKRGRHVVSVGAALLRIADNLDRTHCQVITSVKCKIGKNDVEIALRGRGDAQLELWAAKNRTGLFESVFGREVTLSYADK